MILEIADFIVARSGNFLDDDTETRIVQVTFSQPEDIQEAQRWGMSGFDSNPSPEVKGIVADFGGGYKAVIAEIDGLTDSSLNPGERKVYSDMEGAEMAALTLKNTGQIGLGNGTEDVLDLFDQVLTLLQGQLDSAGVSSTGTNSLINADLLVIQGKLATLKI